MDDDAVRALLLPRISDRYGSIQRWVRRSRTQTNRLTVTGVIAGAIGAAVTAGPAVGGPTFTDSVGAGLGAADSSVVWRVLCLVGMIVSVVSAITAGLLRHYDLSSRLGAAEAALVELDTVRTLLEVGRIPVTDALTRFQQAAASVPFVDGADDQDPVLATPRSHP